MNKLPDEVKEAIEEVESDIDIENFYDENRFLHHKFASHLVNQYNIILLDEKLYYYSEGFYQLLKYDMYRRIVTNIIPNLTENKRKEVFYSLQAIAPIRTRSEAKYIGIKNGILDLEKHKLLPNSPSIIMTNQINASYDEWAHSEVLDNFLNEIANHKQEIRMLLEEFIGYTLWRENYMQKAFFIVAEGANGKSTFFDLLYKFYGENNTASLSFQDTQTQFKLAGLVNKMVSVGDDISASYMRETDIFKKLVTGDRIYADVKHETPFVFNNYAKLIYSSNELPHVKDTTYGLGRRLVIIPFEQKFSRENGNLDLQLSSKLNTDKVRSHLLNIALEGLARIQKNNYFTEPKEVKEAVDNYKKDNSVVIQFVEDVGMDRIVNNYCSQKEIGSEFREWLYDQGLAKKSTKFLTNELERHYGISTGRVTRTYEVDGRLAKGTSERIRAYVLGK